MAASSSTGVKQALIAERSVGSFAGLEDFFRRSTTTLARAPAEVPLAGLAVAVAGANCSVAFAALAAFAAGCLAALGLGVAAVFAGGVTVASTAASPGIS